MDEERTGKRSQSVRGSEHTRRRNARYQMLASFLLAWIAIFLVLNIGMAIRIAVLAFEGRQIGTDEITTSQTA